MHELSIAQNIVEIVQQYVPDGRQVRSVKLELGELSGIVPDSLEFCFGAIIGDTPLEGARLDIDVVPVRALCRGCRALVTIEDAAFVCVHCASTDLQVTSGMEMKVLEIEVGDSEAE